MLRLFERYSHPHEEFVIEPLIQIIFRLSGGGNSKNVQDVNQLKSWSASEANSSGGDGGDGGDGGAPSNFTESFMTCSTLWHDWINTMSRGSSKHRTGSTGMTNETLSMMMHVIYIILIKGKKKKKQSIEIRHKIGVHWTQISVKILNEMQSELLGTASKKGTNILEWKAFTTIQQRNIKTFTMLCATLRVCMEDANLRNKIFHAHFQSPGLTTLWLTLYETLFDVVCLKHVLHVLHLIVMDENTGTLRHDTSSVEQQAVTRPPRKAMLLLESAILGRDLTLELTGYSSMNVTRDFSTPMTVRVHRAHANMAEFEENKRKRRNKKMLTTKQAGGGGGGGGAKKKKQDQAKFSIGDVRIKDKKTTENALKKNIKINHLEFERRFNIGPIGLDLNVWNKATGLGVYVRKVIAKSQASELSNETKGGLQPIHHGDLVVGIGARNKGSNIVGHIDIRRNSVMFYILFFCFFFFLALPACMIKKIRKKNIKKKLKSNLTCILLFYYCFMWTCCFFSSLFLFFLFFFHKTRQLF